MIKLINSEDSYHKSPIKPSWEGGGGLFILNPFEEEGLIETGRPIYFRKDDGISSP